MYHVFGGVVEYAGEIVHGKTSSISHDGKGLFKDVPQGISVTRYHSLAGNLSSLPEELEVTAKTDKDIIMGVRHRKYTVEGVQFHPESILTEEGYLMIRNLLSVTGGTWEENEKAQQQQKSITGSINSDNNNNSSSIANKTQKRNILDEIYS